MKELYNILTEYHSFCSKHNLIKQSLDEFIDIIIKNNMVDNNLKKIYNQEYKKKIEDKYVRVKKDKSNIQIGDPIIWFSKGKMYESKIEQILPSYIKIQDSDSITKGKLGYQRKIYLNREK